MKLRVKFSKHGVLRFIGHLDVMRYFQKAIRRAGIDIAYSAGFSPHQIMSFAAPLGVGLESNGEYMDIEVHSLTSSKEFVDALNAQMVEGIKVLEARLLPDNAGNAMASVAAASYTVVFRRGREPVTDLRAALPAFLARDQVLINKETKKGNREVDIRPGIFQLTMEEGHWTLRMLVDASSSGNIKPAQVMEAILADHNESLKENALIITREDVYTDIGASGKRALVPLDDIGIIC